MLCSILDVLFRTIVGWRVVSRIRPKTFLDAKKMARGSIPTQLPGLRRRNHAGSRFTPISWPESLAETGAAPSTSIVSDSHDGALAETPNGYYKAEPVRGQAPKAAVEGQPAT